MPFLPDWKTSPRFWSKAGGTDPTSASLLSSASQSVGCHVSSSSSIGVSPTTASVRPSGPVASPLPVAAYRVPSSAIATPPGPRSRRASRASYTPAAPNSIVSACPMRSPSRAAGSSKATSTTTRWSASTNPGRHQRAIVPADPDVPSSGVGEPGVPPFAPALTNAILRPSASASAGCRSETSCRPDGAFGAGGKPPAPISTLAPERDGDRRQGDDGDPDRQLEGMGRILGGADQLL